jgi:hypothetical protein
MYQIMMNPDKALITTNRIKLYQREKLIDKIQFIFPKEYESQDLTKLSALLIYTNPMNEIYTELLQISQPDYKDNYFTCVLPIDTKLTKYAGDIILHVQFTQYDEDLGDQVVLVTGYDKMSISTVQDYFQFIPDGVLDPITQKIGELDAKAKELDAISQIYAENQVDDLEIDPENDKLYVTASGVRKGQGVSVVTNGDDGTLDGKQDGVIHINDIPDDDEIDDEENDEEENENTDDDTQGGE